MRLKAEEVEALPEPGEPGWRCTFALCKNLKYEAI
jgi:hypothetical protein